MTRCTEFYEKVKKDGNFCGMSDKEYRRLITTLESAEGNEVANATLSQGALRKQQKKAKEVAKHKTERFVGTENQTELVETEPEKIAKLPREPKETHKWTEIERQGVWDTNVSESREHGLSNEDMFEELKQAILRRVK